MALSAMKYCKSSFHRQEKLNASTHYNTCGLKKLSRRQFSQWRRDLVNRADKLEAPPQVKDRFTKLSFLDHRIDDR